MAFRAELLRRWPQAADAIAPSDHDLGRRQPWGRTDLADRFVALNLPWGWEGTGAVPVLAGEYGLDAYDPQSKRLVPPRDSGVPRDVARIDGWVAEHHVVRLLQQISSYIGYAYDHMDEAALIGALDDTTDEAVDGWFEYPLAGKPVLVVRLAQSPGSAVVSVQVEGATDLVLATRIETLVGLL